MLSVTDITEVPLWKSDGGHSDTWFFQQLSAFASGRLSATGNKVYYGTAVAFTPITVTGEPYSYFIFGDGSLSIGSQVVVSRFSSWDCSMFIDYNSTGPAYLCNALTSTKTDFNTNNNVVNNGDGTYSIIMVTGSESGNAHYMLFTKG